MYHRAPRQFKTGDAPLKSMRSRHNLMFLCAPIVSIQLFIVALQVPCSKRKADMLGLASASVQEFPRRNLRNA